MLWFNCFRSWCYHVLPTVFEDSLSYEEQICKLMHGLEELRKDLEEFSEDALLAKLKAYIDDEIEKLGQEIKNDNALQFMVIEGEISTMDTRYSGQYANMMNWLKQIWLYITRLPDTNYVKSPFTGVLETVESVLNQMYNVIFVDALTCGE